MDFLLGITIMGVLFCLIVIEYAVYRIKEEERIKMRLDELRATTFVPQRGERK
jgi:hypothetical protein